MTKEWDKYKLRECSDAEDDHEAAAEPAKEADAFDLLEAKMRATRSGPSQTDELQSYLRGTSFGEISNPIQWWLHDDQSKRWPHLSRFAVNILSIPAMSAKPERVFSGSRRTMSWDRVQISPKLLEATECQKDWKRSGVLSGPL